MENITTLRNLDPKNETVVGYIFRAYSIKNGVSALYFCDSHDPMGYWMTNLYDVNDRTNVSERAIGKTYHYTCSNDKISATIKNFINAELISDYDKAIRTVISIISPILN